jgi:hypothetical protein
VCSTGTARYVPFLSEVAVYLFILIVTHIKVLYRYILGYRITYSLPTVSCIGKFAMKSILYTAALASGLSAAVVAAEGCNVLDYGAIGTTGAKAIVTICVYFLNIIIIAIPHIMLCTY